MVAYADTSFLFSLYAQDANTPRAAALASAPGPALPFTPLHRHELRNALRLAVFRGHMTAADCQAVLADLGADAGGGVLAETAVPSADVYARAEVLSAAHTARLGTRALDVLHVAAALTLGADEFLTFDARQRALAAEVGMRVRP